MEAAQLRAGSASESVEAGSPVEGMGRLDEAEFAETAAKVRLRASRAMAEAIALERRALELYEAASVLHQSAADHVERVARRSPEGDMRTKLMAHAVGQRARAHAIRGRAERLRARLAADNAQWRNVEGPHSGESLGPPAKDGIRPSLRLAQPDEDYQPLP